MTRNDPATATVNRQFSLSLVFASTCKNSDQNCSATGLASRRNILPRSGQRTCFLDTPFSAGNSLASFVSFSRSVPCGDTDHLYGLTHDAAVVLLISEGVL